ncbi:unnamed protein product, partial [Mesorhabditis spiculigera]
MRRLDDAGAFRMWRRRPTAQHLSASPSQSGASSYQDLDAELQRELNSLELNDEGVRKALLVSQRLPVHPRLDAINQKGRELEKPTTVLSSRHGIEPTVTELETGEYLISHQSSAAASEPLSKHEKLPNTSQNADDNTVSQFFDAPETATDKEKEVDAEAEDEEEAEHDNQVQVPGSAQMAENKDYPQDEDPEEDLEMTTRPQFTPYLTYYNQMCDGEVLGASGDETMATAAEKCAELGCEAANARPIGGGRYQVTFLDGVRQRRNLIGSYCVSGKKIPLRREIRRQMRHRRGPWPARANLRIRRIADLPKPSAPRDIHLRYRTHTQLVYCGACESVCVCVSATQQATIRLQQGRSYAGGARSPLSPHRLVWDLTSSVPSSSSAYDLPSGSGPSTKLLNQAPGPQTTPFDAADRRKERQQPNPKNRQFFGAAREGRLFGCKKHL